MTPPPTIFDVKQLARYLKVKTMTIYKHANLGLIPAFKIGSHWRFRKEAIDTWISKQEKLK